MTDTEMWDFDVIQAFRDNLIGFSFSRNDVVKEIVVKRHPYLLFNRGYKEYILDLDLEVDLPLKVNKTEVVKYGKKVYNEIVSESTIKINPIKSMEFDDLIMSFSDYKHTDEKDWLLWKILVFAGFNSRVNLRVAAKPFFGKNSVVQTLALLTQDVSVFHPKSMPAIEYRLGTKLMALDEVGTITTNSYADFQDFLLLTGDLRPQYHKPTRASKAYDTKDVYDISNMSLFLMYNDIDTYKDSDPDYKEKYFDFRMNKAVRNRILPIKLEGHLYSGQFRNFTGKEEVDEVAKQHSEKLTEFLKNIQYYRENWYKELKQKKIYETSVPSLLEGTRKHASFIRFSKMINLFTDDKDEFQELVSFFWDRVLGYEKMILKERSNGNTGLDVFKERDKFSEKIEVIE